MFSFAMRGFCTAVLDGNGIARKDVLVSTYQEVGDEARKIMIETEARMRNEVSPPCYQIDCVEPLVASTRRHADPIHCHWKADEKADSGVDVELCASMYGHQMAG